MALSAVKTWIAGEVLFASDLNAEFANILNNGEDLQTPATKAHDMDGFEFILDSDGDTSLTADTDDQIDIRIQAVDAFILDGTTASIVNGLTFAASATGNAPSIQAQGSDTNIDIELTPKGTGIVTVDGSNTFDPIAVEAFSA